MATTPAPGAGELPYCYLTTTGRVSGRPHEIEIWFALRGTTVYLLAETGERADWVKNLRKTPAVRLRLGCSAYAGEARALEREESEDGLARRLIAAKYEGWREGEPLPEWVVDAVAVAVSLGEEQEG
jgi:deazaflavin-dependent oxidoreductase (nitroreductase family)